MKRFVLPILLTVLITTCSQILQAQNNLLPDQNPGYAASRDKYMKLADSLNTWHSTTMQERYKAIDYLADKREARLERKAFQRQLRLNRAANRWSYNDPFYDYNYNPFTSSRYYRNPYNYRYSNSNYWSNLPLVVTLALLLR